MPLNTGSATLHYITLGYILHKKSLKIPKWWSESI